MPFAGLVARDLTRRDRSSSPGSIEDHLRESLAWLCRAQDQAKSGGVSYGYSLRGGWLAPYRETSGYILPTFYRAADALGDPELASRAERIARWLLRVQNEDGSFANTKYGPDGIVFDTGQCLFGLLSAFERTQDQLFLDAALKAGQWLVAALGDDPQWKRFEHMGTPHVYNTRTAWALLKLNQAHPSASFESAARRNLDWAVASQTPEGYFSHNAFRAGDAPYTHNISYAICGLQESGWILGDETYVAAAKRCSEAVRVRLDAAGFIPGRISPAGDPDKSFSCLTGQAQLAVVWAKQFLRDGNPEHSSAAVSSLAYVKRHHRLTHANPAVRGAVAGSYPIWGRYAPMSFPNWAAKFFVDALLLEREIAEAS